MMFRNLLLTVNFLIFSACASDLFGGFIVTLVTSALANDSPDARLPVFVRWDGLGTNPPIRGIRLSAAIGNAAANQSGTPSFRDEGGARDGILFADGATPEDELSNNADTVWQSFSPPAQSGGFSPSADNVFLTTNVSVADALDAPDITHQFSIANELVAEFRINTVGISNQQFNFTIGQIGSGTSALLSASGDQNISFTGTFNVGNVSAVPEPGSVTLALLACAGAVGVKKRRLRLTRRRGVSGKTLIQ